MRSIMKQYKMLKNFIGEDRDLKLTDEDALRCQDVLLLLEERSYIHNMRVDGMNWYRKMVEWDGFEEWLNDQIKEEKSVSRREFIIGIICAIIGAVIGLVPYIVSLLSA